MSDKRIVLQIVSDVTNSRYSLMAYGNMFGKGRKLLSSSDKLTVIDKQDSIACQYARRGYFVESAKDLVKII